MNTNKPAVSLLLLAFQAENFISDAMNAALEQEYDNLEIIISDDCSKDSTYRIIKDLAKQYNGPHKIVLNRNEVNLGLVEHINKLINIASGEIIILAAGDDVSFKYRVCHSVNALLEHENAVAVSYGTVSTSGISNFPKPCDYSLEYKHFDFKKLIKSPEFHLHGATRAFYKKIFTQFGPLNPTCQTEDSTSLLRFLIAGKVLYNPEPMIFYRRHDNNISGSDKRYLLNDEVIHQQYLEDLNKALDLDMLTTTDARKLKNALEVKLTIRRLKKGLFEAGNKTWYLLTKVLPNSRISAKRKLRFFKSS